MVEIQTTVNVWSIVVTTPTQSARDRILNFLQLDKVLLESHNPFKLLLVRYSPPGVRLGARAAVIN